MNRIYRYASLLMAAVMLFASCGDNGTNTSGGDEPDVPVGGTLTLDVDKLIIQANGEDAATLTVKFNDEAITDGIVIFDGNNQPVDLGSAFKFTASNAGDYTFWANYKTFNSNSVMITAVDTPVPETPADPQPDNLDFVKRVLLTKITGAGCVACPNVTSAIHAFYHGTKDEAPHELAQWTVKAEAHTYEGGYDPAQLTTGFYNTTSWPKVFVDWYYEFMPQSNIVTLHAIEEYVEDRYSVEPLAGIAVNSIHEGNAITLKVVVKAAESGQYRVGAWLLEDGIQGSQQGAPTGEGNEWYHIFNDCIRIADSKAGAGAYNGVKVGYIEKGKTAEKMFTWTLKDSWVKENLKLCIFVSAEDDEVGYAVTNVITSPINGETPFEYAK